MADPLDMTKRKNFYNYTDEIPQEEDGYQSSYEPQDQSNLFGSIGDGIGKAWDSTTSFLGKAFGSSSDSSSKSTGSWDLKGLGSVASGIGSIWDAYNKKEYQDEMVDMEKARVAREVDKQTKAQAALDKAWA